MTAEPRQVFVLRIAAPPGAAGIHALRACLKFLLRRWGLRVISIDAIDKEEVERRRLHGRDQARREKSL
jgi:hypothetical protein